MSFTLSNLVEYIDKINNLLSSRVEYCVNVTMTFISNFSHRLSGGDLELNGIPHGKELIQSESISIECIP